MRTNPGTSEKGCIMFTLNIKGLFDSIATGIGSVRRAGLFLLGATLLGPAAAAELSYQLQSTLVGGNNAALLAAENTRANAVKQAKERAVADELQRIRDLENAAAATPEARFLSSLQSQIYFAVSQRIAASLADPNAALAPVTMGDSTVTFARGVGTLTVTVVTPSGTSVMVLPIPQ
jgi:hypothetical protein